jgi:YVTN family beta-propeller protein
VAVNPLTNKIYVANDGDSSVTVIDGATNATTRITVAVGSNPRAIAVNPVTNKIYVACYKWYSTDGSVTVIDGATNMSTSTVDAWYHPDALAVNTVTNRIYVASLDGSYVTVIDGATNGTATVATGTKPWAVAVNPVTNKIYVANYNSNNVTVIDGATNTTTTVGTGTGPYAVAVNPVSNKIYVANYNSVSNIVTVIDGATNTTTAVTVGQKPCALAVNPVTKTIYVANSGDSSVTVIMEVMGFYTTDTVAVGKNPRSIAVNTLTNKIYVANSHGKNVTVIDGATNATATVAVDSIPIAVAVNPVTNRIYVANDSGNNVTVIDGAAAYDTTIVAAGAFPVVAPVALAVNPVTNKIYVASSGGSNKVSIIEGAYNSVTGAYGVGAIPEALAVNPVTNKIYVANSNSASVTMILGTPDTGRDHKDTAIVAVGFNPNAIAINPATDKIYVANYGSDYITRIDGLTNTTTTMAVGSFPIAIAVVPGMNLVYVVNSGSNSITAFDETYGTKNTVATGSEPCAVAVNPVTGMAYVANYSSANVTVTGGASSTTVAVGTNPQALAVNPVTNKIYVANYGSANVTVINGATNGTTTIAAGLQPWAVTVDPIRNKIFVANYGSNNVTVIDGATNTTTAVATGNHPQAVAVNPVTGRVYVANSGSSNVTEIDNIKSISDTKVWAIVDSLPNHVTHIARPTLAGKGVNRATPKPTTRIEGVMRGLKSLDSPWAWTTIASRAGTDSIGWAMSWGTDSLMRGENFVLCVAMESDAATTNNLGLGTPFAGNLMVYPVYRVNPTPPTLVSPLDLSVGQPLSLTFSWNAVNEATFYVLSVSSDSLFSTFMSGGGTYDTSRVVTGLSVNTTYFWRVEAENTNGRSDWSLVRRFSTVAINTPVLSSPATGAINQPLSPTLSWDTVSTAASYCVQVATDTAFSGLFLQDSTLTDTIKQVSGLANGTTYYWRVRAKNAGGTVSTWSSYRSFTTIGTLPSAVVTVAPADSATIVADSVRLAWNIAAPAVDRYLVEVTTDSAMTNFVVRDSSVTDTTRLVNSLVDHTTYYWRVKAHNAAGWGSYSAETRFVTSFVGVLFGRNALRAFSLTYSSGMLHYTLPEQCFVSIKYYDIRGRMVASYVGRVQGEGSYSLRLPSWGTGAYIQVFTAGEIVRKNRIMVIK